MNFHLCTGLVDLRLYGLYGLELQHSHTSWQPSHHHHHRGRRAHKPIKLLLLLSTGKLANGKNQSAPFRKSIPEQLLAYIKQQIIYEL